MQAGTLIADTGFTEEYLSGRIDAMPKKLLFIFLKLILFGLFVQEGQADYQNVWEAGESQRRAGKYAEARENYKKALEMSTSGTEKANAQIGLALTYDEQADNKQARIEFGKVFDIQEATPDQAAQAHWYIGKGYTAERKYPTARVELEKALAVNGVSTVWKVQSWMSIGNIYTRERRYEDARAAYAAVTGISGVSEKEKADAMMAAAYVFIAEKNYEGARNKMKDLLKEKKLPPTERVAAQMLLARTWFLDRNFPSAREEFAKALSLKGISDTNKAEARLNIGLCFYRAGDYEKAGTELKRVLSMKGATERQIHEARLWLRMRRLIPDKEVVITAFFIGASHTYVWNIPQMVEAISASAPAGTPRIIAGGFLRGGTMIDKFWEEGPGPDTARGRLAAEQWDVLVMETFFTLPYEKLVKYGTLFAELVCAGKGVTVIYESPVNSNQPYPAKFKSFHADNLTLGKQLKAKIAPSVIAWMYYLGPEPTTEQRLSLYGADKVHTSKKGAYMAACCIYSAITGLSPIGLSPVIPSFGSDQFSKEDAQRLQEASWKAFLDANPAE